MTIAEARAIAIGEQEAAAAMGGSVAHPETEKRARLAAIILDLCAQLEALQMAAAWRAASGVPETEPEKPRSKKR